MPSTNRVVQDQAGRPPSAGGLFQLNRLRSPAAIVATLFIAASGVAIAAWQVSASAPTSQVEPSAFAQAESKSPLGIARVVVVNDPVEAFRTANPLKTYFGFPLIGRTIGCVVDSDSTMAPYIDKVAFVTNTLNEAMEPGSRRLGIVMATGRDGPTVLEVAEPSADLAGARTVLGSRLPAGDTDLSSALLKTASWYADTIFLVLSKPIDASQLGIITEHAEQTGAVTHVIALGGAAKQDLSAISNATGGGFLPVTDLMLGELVPRVEQYRRAWLAGEPLP
jgi:hypothetical protein